MLKRVIAGLAVAGSLAASPLYANTYCYTSGGFSACASAAITVNAGQTQLQVAIQNLSNNGGGNTVYTLTGFGFYYLNPPAYTGSLALTSGPAGWVNGPNSGGKSLTGNGPIIPSGFTGATWLGGAHATSSAHGGLLGCAALPNNTSGISTCAGPITYTFSLSNTANFSLANVNFALHGQSWQGGTLGRTPDEEFFCYQTNTRSCIVTSAVPEPATMGLLAIGLVGMGGVGLARARRKSSK